MTLARIAAQPEVQMRRDPLGQILARLEAARRAGVQQRFDRGGRLVQPFPLLGQIGGRGGLGIVADVDHHHLGPGGAAQVVHDLAGGDRARVLEIAAVDQTQPFGRPLSGCQRTVPAGLT